MKKNIIVVIFILLSVAFGGCGTTQGTKSKPENTTTAAKKELTVAAASDLTKAFAEVGASFEKANNCKIKFSFGSTGTLSQQITNGAPFDVFASADANVIEDLDKKGYIVSDTKKLYALGRIGIATQKDSKIEAKTMQDLLKPEVKKIAIANPDHAPYGLAAKQALEKAGLWDKVQYKLVYGKNISDTVTLITTGNADAGFIALSLKDDKKLNFNIVDANMHAPLKQGMAVTKNAKEEELGRKFIQYVNSTEGKKIMGKYGFVAPEE